MHPSRHRRASSSHKKKQEKKPVNRVYRLVFNRARGMLQAVSEIAHVSGGGMSCTARCPPRPVEDKAIDAVHGLLLLLFLVA